MPLPLSAKYKKGYGYNFYPAHFRDVFVAKLSDDNNTYDRIYTCGKDFYCAYPPKYVYGDAKDQLDVYH